MIVIVLVSLIAIDVCCLLISYMCTQRTNSLFRNYKDLYSQTFLAQAIDDFAYGQMYIHVHVTMFSSSQGRANYYTMLVNNLKMSVQA
jgi:hypothetical protein